MTTDDAERNGVRVDFLATVDPKTLRQANVAARGPTSATQGPTPGRRDTSIFPDWCPWPDSNQHSLRNLILSQARLPIPPQGHAAGSYWRKAPGQRLLKRGQNAVNRQAGRAALWVLPCWLPRKI